MPLTEILPNKYKNYIYTDMTDVVSGVYYSISEMMDNIPLQINQLYYYDREDIGNNTERLYYSGLSLVWNSGFTHTIEIERTSINEFFFNVESQAGYLLSCLDYNVNSNLTELQISGINSYINSVAPNIYIIYNPSGYIDVINYINGGYTEYYYVNTGTTIIYPHKIRIDQLTPHSTLRQFPADENTRHYITYMLGGRIYRKEI